MTALSRSTIHRRFLALVAALAFALLALPAAANNIAARMEAEGPVAPGGTVTLAIAMDPAKTWHGYWLNPGDAGFGMSFDWTLPAGYRAGTPEYPVPEALIIGTLMNHVYEGPYAILVPLTVPTDAKPGSEVPIRLAANWLACTDQICVPERGTFDTTVTIAQPGIAQAESERFAKWRSALPAPLDAKGRYAIAGDRLRVAIPVAAAASVAEPHFFAARDDVVQYAAPQDFARDGDWLIVETKADPDAAADAPFDAVLRLDPQGNGLAVTLEPGEVPTGGTPLAGSPDLGGNLAWLVLAAFVGGLILNVMPCVFPILSLKALALAKANREGAHHEAVAYTGGVMVAVLALGALLLGLRAAGEEVGWAFQLQEPATVVLLLVLAAAITANLAGLYEMVLPGISGSERGGAFLTGLLAAFVATPCTGPFMAAAMGAALLLPVAHAMLLFAALGLGLAFPFLLVGFVPALRRALPKPGAWMVRFRHAMAVPMGLTALALAWLTWRVGGMPLLGLALLATLIVILLLVLAGRRQRRGHGAGWPVLAAVAIAIVAGGTSAAMEPAAPTSEAALDAVPYSARALAEARASGKPVFAYFTADWCVTCKVNEAAAIERADTKVAFEKAGVVVIRGDWTRRDPAITRYLEEHGAAGVPLYAWYAPGKEAEILPQVLTVGMLTERTAALIQ
ncbi:thioredoxin family protein [Croceicoccus sp. BE223]|uniref:protein-disulfide reductase DsbD family protein n=1 Tax=Croceicoccus sp. BE223 TaxID=2817716 RepID=UPI00285C5E3F|nr:thioredoxin family protein [Croceicoccus sp. BE223]MDR7104075.1 DsbC/DsbD-like thiol-disulfide interchange protein/cytochrome c biogenesis protein CcdA [Croceicoccus sp. BE223]